jgi:hypothetical protein
VASLAGPAPGASDLIDAAVRQLRTALPSLAALAALLAVPTGLLVGSWPLWPVGWPRVVVAAVPPVAALVVGLPASLYLLGDAGLGRPPAVASALRRVVRRLPSLLLLGVWVTGQVALGLVLFVLPGLRRLGAAQLAFPVLVLEEVGPFEAWRRARFLTRRHEGLAVSTQAGILALAACLAALPVGVLLLVLPRPGLGSDALATTRLLGAGVLLGIVVLPALAAGQFAVFLSRRERLEALDLQLALQALDEAPPLSAGVVTG